jgi:hypothetical protein
MFFETRQILGPIIGLVAGFFLSSVLREETPGDRIVAAARAEQSPAVVLVGPTGKVKALDTERGHPIRDCNSGDCKTDVNVLPSGALQLVNKATGQPVSKIHSEIRMQAWHFELSPGCRRIWPGGEICW